MRPKDPKLKALQGGPGHRRIPENPKPRPLVSLKPLEGMSEYGRKYFQEMAPRLIKLGLLTELDVGAFEILCVAYGEIREFSDILLKDGYTVPDGRGGVKKHPCCTLLKQARENYIGLCGKFGLHPTSRFSMHIEPHDDLDDDLLS